MATVSSLDRGKRNEEDNTNTGPKKNKSANRMRKTDRRGSRVVQG